MIIWAHGKKIKKMLFTFGVIFGIITFNFVQDVC